MHKDFYVTKWVVGITTRMVGMCEEGFVIPVIVLFYNDVASADVLKSKLDLQRKLASFAERVQSLRRLPWYSVGTRIKQSLVLLRERIALHISAMRMQPHEGAINKCLESAEFKFLQYLHKLTQRMRAWRSFADKHLPVDQLPAEFRTVKGPSDPPQAEYSFLCRIQEMADSFIPQEMQRTMFSLMLAEKLASSRQLSPSHRECADSSHALFLKSLNSPCRYRDRLNDLLLEFGAKMSDRSSG